MVNSLPSHRRSIPNLLSEIGGTEDCALKRAMRGGDFVGSFQKRNPRPDALFPASNRTRLPLGMIYFVWHETFLPSGTLRPVPSCASRVVARQRRSRCGGRGLRQAGCVAACPAAGCSMPQSVIMRVQRGAFLRALTFWQSVPGSA